MISGPRISSPIGTSSWRQVTWWKWLILGHAVHVAILVHRQFASGDSWLRPLFKPFNLASEMNYAVWWSGICLFIAAILFHRCRISGCKFERNISWSILSIFSMGLVIDEIGSFHEKIIREFGFGGLLPIALVVGGAVCYSIVRLYRDPVTRKSAILVSLAIVCFIAVAGLELVENSINMDSSLLKPIRLIVEEAMELTGTTLLIFAGLIALPLQNNESPELVFVAGEWSGLSQLDFLVSLLYLVHLLFFFGTLNIDAWSFRAGNPISIFPITVLFLLSLRCFYLSRTAAGSLPQMLLVLAVLLLLVSIGQTMNLALYIGKSVFGSKPNFLISW